MTTLPVRTLVDTEHGHVYVHCPDWVLPWRGTDMRTLPDEGVAHLTPAVLLTRANGKELAEVLQEMVVEYGSVDPDSVSLEWFREVIERLIERRSKDGAV